MILIEWQVLIIGLAVVIYAAYQVGKLREQKRECKRYELRLAANNAQDPEERRRLLLKWNKLTDDRSLRKAFEASMKAESKQNVNAA